MVKDLKCIAIVLINEFLFRDILLLETETVKIIVNY